VSAERNHYTEVIMSIFTINPIGTTEADAIRAEFLRTEDVRRVFGIKRGTLYNLHKARSVRGAVIRRRGNTKGIRVWDAQSIRDYIQSQMSISHELSG
jgi:hypothetical protein